MLALPEKLYQLLTKDRGAVTPRILFRRRTVTSAAATIAVSILNDSGQLWICTSFAFGTTPGGGQTQNSTQVIIQDAAGISINTFAAESTVGGVAVNTFRSFSGCWHIPPLHNLVGQASFSGAVANLVEFNFAGIQIPTGTITF